MLHRTATAAGDALTDRILFIDAEAIVIDKPAGLPVDTPRRGGDSIVSRLDELRFGFSAPPTPMHRLDSDTSGCLLFARIAQGARRASSTRSRRARVEKYYLAVVAARLPRSEGMIDGPLAKVSSAEAGWRMVARSRGPRRRRTGAGSPCGTAPTWSCFGRRPAAPTRSASTRARRSGAASSATGLRLPGGPMLLHASRLVVPGSGKPAIDVTAPLPDHFAEWRSHAQA